MQPMSIFLASYTFSVDAQNKTEWIDYSKTSVLPIIEKSDFILSYNFLEVVTEMDPDYTTFSLLLNFNSLPHYELFDSLHFAEILAQYDERFGNQYGYFRTLLKSV